MLYYRTISKSSIICYAEKLNLSSYLRDIIISIDIIYYEDITKIKNVYKTSIGNDILYCVQI